MGRKERKGKEREREGKKVMVERGGKGSRERRGKELHDVPIYTRKSIKYFIFSSPTQLFVHGQ